jgi:hypothetical protein
MTVKYEITFDDPVIWERPWVQTYGMKLHPTWKILEYVCEENNQVYGRQLQTAVGKYGVRHLVALFPEPQEITQRGV